MSEEEKLETLKNKFLKYHLEYKDEEMLFEIIGRLQKENKKYIDIFNSIEKIMNRQERTKDKLLKENVELQKELDNSINKDIIRAKIKEAEKNYESCSKGNVVEKAYYRNKIDTLKELLGE